MAITISRGTSDETIDQIVSALEKYQADHQKSQIALYRRNQVSIRVRIIDPDFAGHGKAQRSQQVWRYLDPVSEDAQSDISMMLLLTPEETERSFGNMEFENPVPSEL